MDLADAITDALAVPTGARLRTAVVASATATTATVDLAGATVTGVPFLASYTPSAGHVVNVLQDGSVLLILGKSA